MNALMNHSRRISLAGVALAFFVGPLLSASAAQLEIVAGGGSRVENAPATECKLSQPFGIAFDSHDNMYICEETNRILRVDAKTGILTVVVSVKPKDAPLGDNGPASAACLKAPHNLVSDASGNLYIADSYHYLIRRIDTKTGIITTVAGTGDKAVSGDGGPATKAGLGWDACLAFNHDYSRLFISGDGRNGIRILDIKDGTISTLAGIGGNRCHAVDSEGNVILPTARGLRIRNSDGKTQVVEDPIAAPLKGVKHLWADRDDNILIADAGNHLIRKFIVAERKLVILAGTGKQGAAGVPGPPLQAQLGEPHGVTTHPRTGDIYIADSRNHRVLKLSEK